MLGSLPETQSEVFGLFKVFKALVENQFGRKLKVLRYENGGEYVKFEFIQYCVDVGIQMQHSIPYTPQQNGVVERKNRSLKEMATYHQFATKVMGRSYKLCSLYSK